MISANSTSGKKTIVTGRGQATVSSQRNFLLATNRMLPCPSAQGDAGAHDVTKPVQGERPRLREEPVPSAFHCLPLKKEQKEREVVVKRDGGYEQAARRSLCIVAFIRFSLRAKLVY